MIRNLLILFSLVFISISTPVFASINVCHTGETITRTSLRGDIPGCEHINAIGSDTTKYDWTKVLIQTIPRKYLKWDANIIVGSKLVEMSQAEKDAVDALEAQAQADTETARQEAFDNALADSAPSDATMVRVDAYIDAMNDYAKLRTLLKRMTRYMYKNRGSL